MKVAMLLAAGRGERLKPLTKTIPKALCTINGLSLIERHLMQLAEANFSRVVINHAYLGGFIRRQLGDGKRFGLQIDYSPEPPGALETGGGIVNALPLLGSEPFLAVNTDIVTDFNFASLDLALVKTMHLVLVPTNPALQHHGDLGLSATGLLTSAPLKYIFSGIACYHPAIFKTATIGRYSMAPMIKQYAAGGLATGELYQGQWFDIGSQERLQAAQRFYARSEFTE